MASEKYLQLLKEEGLLSLDHIEARKYDKNDSIAGVIVSTKDIKPPTSTRADALLSFYISDPSIKNDIISVTMFQEDIKVLEHVKSGHFIILKNFHVKSFNNRLQISVNRYTKFAIFEPNSLTLIYRNYLYSLLDNDVIKALDLAERDNQTTHALPKSRPLLETNEIVSNPSKFFDYVGEIVEIDSNDDRVVLLLTDYTKNPLPLTSSDEHDRSHLIYCTVWDSLIEQCEELKAGDFIYLQNCCKKDTDPLEFVIRTSEDKNLISKIEPDSSRLSKLIERKQFYETAYNKNSNKRSWIETIPISTTIVNLPRKFTSIQKVKEAKKRGRYQVQAHLTNYEPKNINDWIQSWCVPCAVPSPAYSPCRKCNGITELFYKALFTLKDENEDELKVYAYGKNAQELFLDISPERALSDEESRNQIEKIMDLATDRTIFFEFCFISAECKDEFIYQFKNTRFILD